MAKKIAGTEDLKKAAKRVTDAYEAWLQAGLAYNIMVHEHMASPVTTNYTIDFVNIGKKKKHSWRKRL